MSEGVAVGRGRGPSPLGNSATRHLGDPGPRAWYPVLRLVLTRLHHAPLASARAMPAVPPLALAGAGAGAAALKAGAAALKGLAKASMWATEGKRQGQAKADGAPALTQPGQWHYAELLALPVFASMPRLAFDLLVEDLAVVDYDPDAVVFEQGDQLGNASPYYVVVSGSVDVFAHVQRQRSQPADGDSPAATADVADGTEDTDASKASDAGERNSRAKMSEKVEQLRKQQERLREAQAEKRKEEKRARAEAAAPHLPYLVQLRRNSLEIRKLDIADVQARGLDQEVYEEVKFEETDHMLGSLITHLEQGESFGEDAFLGCEIAGAGGMRYRSTSVKAGPKGVRLASLPAGKYIRFVQRVGHFFFAPLQCAAIASLSPEKRTSEELALLAENCRSLSFFQRLSTELMERVCRHVVFHRMPVSSLLFREGECPDQNAHFYILRSGDVTMRAGVPMPQEEQAKTRFEGTGRSAVPPEKRAEFYGDVVGRIYPGESFGEKCLLKGCEGAARTTTAVCETDCEFFTLPRDSFRELERELTSVLGSAEAMQKALRKPMDEREDVDVELLMSKTGGIDFLQTLNPEVFREVCRHAKLKSFGGDSVIFSEGMPGDAFYVILLGSVSLHVRGDDHRNSGGKMESFESQMSGGAAHGKCVQILSRGQAFGEYALMRDDNRRSATAVALTDVHLMVIAKGDFNKILEDAVSKEETNKKANFLVKHVPGLQDAYSRAISLSYGLVERRYDRFQKIIVEGAQGKSCFLVKEGLVQLSISRFAMQSKRASTPETMSRPRSPEKPPMRVTLPLTQLSTGAMVGEYAIIFQKPEPYTVVASGHNCVMYEMPKEVFMNLPTLCLDVVREESFMRNEQWASRLTDIIENIDRAGTATSPTIWLGASKPLGDEASSLSVRPPQFMASRPNSENSQMSIFETPPPPSAEASSAVGSRRVQRDEGARSPTPLIDGEESKLDTEVRRIMMRGQYTRKRAYAPPGKRYYTPQPRLSEERSAESVPGSVPGELGPLQRCESSFASISNEKIVGISDMHASLMRKKTVHIPSHVSGSPYWPCPSSYKREDDFPRTYVRNATAHTVDTNAVALARVRSKRIEREKYLAQIERRLGVADDQEWRKVTLQQDALPEIISQLQLGGPSLVIENAEKRKKTNEALEGLGIAPESLEELPEEEKIREQRRKRHLAPGPKLDVKTREGSLKKSAKGVPQATSGGRFAKAAHYAAVAQRLRKDYKEQRGDQKTFKSRERSALYDDLGEGEVEMGAGTNLLVDDMWYQKSHKCPSKRLIDMSKSYDQSVAEEVNATMKGLKSNEKLVKSHGSAACSLLKRHMSMAAKVRGKIYT